MDKIVCVGKNYADHVKEMGGPGPSLSNEKPVLFLKPPSVLRAALANGETLSLPFPAGRGEVHHECEIVLRLDASGGIGWVTAGLDMTLRDLQAELKKKGHPWTVSKVFPGAAVVGPWVPVAAFPDWLDAELAFTVDGQVRQRANARQMVLPPAACVAHASGYFPLCPGDLIFTGTPAGVGPVRPGSRGGVRWGKIQYEVVWDNTTAC